MDELINVDFNSPFNPGEKSSRTIDTRLSINPDHVTVFWSGNSPWGQHSFIRNPDLKTFSTKIMIDTTNLAAGSYEDVFMIKIAPKPVCIKVCFKVAESDEVHSEPVNSPSDVSLLITPEIVDLGVMSQGDSKIGSFTVQNVGKLLWSSPSIYWKTSNPAWSQTLYNPANKIGKTFPYTITFPVNTAKCPPGTYRQEIVVEIERKRYVILVNFQVTKLAPPVLELKYSRIDLGTMRINGHNHRTRIDVGNLGGKIAALECRWRETDEASQICFQPPVVVSPQQIYFDINLNEREVSPGDYIGELMLVGRNHAGDSKLRIPVGVRLVDNATPQAARNDSADTQPRNFSHPAVSYRFHKDEILELGTIRMHETHMFSVLLEGVTVEIDSDLIWSNLSNPKYGNWLLKPMRRGPSAIDISVSTFRPNLQGNFLIELLIKNSDKTHVIPVTLSITD